MMTLIVFWMAGLVYYKAPEYGRLFEMTIVMLWLIGIIPIVIGKIIWNYNHPDYTNHYCDSCGSKDCCVKEVHEDDEEEPQE